MNHPPPLLSLLRSAPLLLLTFALFSSPSHLHAQDRVFFTLNNGMTIGPARRTDIETIKREASVNNAGIGGAKLIVEADDGLRLIHFHRVQITDGAQERWTLARPQIKIELPNKDRVANSRQSQQIIALSEFPQVFEFSDLGRRYYRLPDGRIAVQGITEITPSYVRVEGMAGGEGDFKWDMRIGLNSIPSPTLRSILLRNADPNRPRSYLDIVELYETAKRYTEAREVLVYAMQKFPELENHRSSLKRYDQLAADQLFTAAEFAKRKAGQHRFAKRILDSIDPSLLSLETQLKVDRQKELIANERAELEELIKWIEEDIGAITDGEIREEMAAILPEIEKYLTPDLSVRFSDYRRLRQNTKPESRAALAIGGWLLGEGVADDNIALISSVVKARKIVQEYLSAPSNNEQHLEELAKLEAGTARYVSRIVANMAPPIETAEENLFPMRTIPDPETPSQVNEVTIPGRYLLEVPLSGALKGQSVHYLVQLPPEYNPLRRYPCVLTMHGAMSNPESQLQWWCGSYDLSSERCWGEAARNGYIVVAPYWTRPELPNYGYTEEEHVHVLASLFDAKRRFSIDTDRVFLSGHEVGGNGAWDIALAHPDLWAGCVVICGLADKYVRQVFPNTLYVPFYFVSGELAALQTNEGVTSHRVNNERVLDQLLTKRTFDVMLSEYIGRGLDHFQEELPRIMEWMNAPGHVRNFAPERFEVKTARAGDRYFWWFETDQLLQQDLVHPLLPYKGGKDYKIESRLIKETNLIDMIQIPANQYTVNLTAQMVDMTRPIQVRGKGSSTTRTIEPPTDASALLRDVRQRADRQHPFWIRISMPK